MVPDASLLGTKHEGEVPFDILVSCLGGMLPDATETEDGPLDHQVRQRLTIF